MDGVCIASNPGTEPLVLSDTAIIVEFKSENQVAEVTFRTLSSTHELIDFLKLVSTASHILNIDPRRTLVYGVRLHLID